MKKQIIVTKNNENLASFAEARHFVLYQKTEAKWRQADVYECPHSPGSAQALREMVGALTAHYEDCRVIVSKKVTGIAYQTLNKAGFEIFEADAVTEGLLDDVIADILSAQAAVDTPPQEPYSPQNDGNYYFDLVRLQKAYPEISSKRALMSFMQNAVFLSLELICDHLPPWMEDVMMTKGMHFRVDKTQEGFNKVNISKKTCQ